MSRLIIRCFILVLLLSACDFVDSAIGVKEALTTQNLSSYTMEPMNPFGTNYEIDYKNKAPQRFDIIEFKYQDEFFDSKDFYSSDQHVSRVIALPNETVEMKSGVVYVNGELLDQPFLIDTCISTDNMEQLTISEDAYFVMVDYRSLFEQDSLSGVAYKSYDSRFIGTVHKSKIVGVTSLK